MHLSGLDYAAAAGAALVSGAVNSVAGGGTLISFPALVAIGIAPVPANITNTVSLLPGYLAGTWAQREDLGPQLGTSRSLSLVAAGGGLAGSVLLVLIPSHFFRSAVPFLILISCMLMLAQDRLRRLVAGDAGHPGDGATVPAGGHRGLLALSVFVAAVYGGFFGAGLGIMLLAVLGVFLHGPLVRLNALKQALSFVVNLIAAIFFCFSGRVVWLIVPVMAVGSLCGGYAGSHLVTRIDEKSFRALVILAGLGAAIGFWVT